MDIIRILLVDDHGVVRDGLGRMLELEEDMEIVGKASNAEETLSKVESISPDIILMDIKMPGIDGIELTRQVKERLPSCNVIIFTLHGDYLTQAVDAGASGYLLKDIRRGELTRAIRQVHRGQVVINESIKPML
jgi:DNA-binding NarL/FixJ family response regulator